jgi:hypothetical protein
MSSSYVRHAPLDDSWLDDSSTSSSNTDNNYDPDVDNNMPLPPENFYTTQDKLFDAIQAWAKEYKYAFRIGRSKAISGSGKSTLMFALVAEKHLLWTVQKMTPDAHVTESALLVRRKLGASSLYVVSRLTIIDGKYAIGQMLSSASITILKAILL